jgi:hypothetical protein
MLERKDIDIVIIATPWQWHARMCVDAMQAGKHAFTEVPAALTVEECWQLVDTSERTGKYCMMMENCCYGREELFCLNLVRQGLLGELLHAEAAYIHELRSQMNEVEHGTGSWRTFHYAKRNGNLYPTHGLGPVAHYMDINRGERFDYMVSMSSPSLSLQAYRKEKVPADDPRQKEVYRNGDLNVSLIKTAKGRMITLEHEVATPQPYDRINLIAGTKGIFRDYPPRIYVDGDRREEFGPLDPYKEKFTHPYWKQVGELAREMGGHGGMDFVMAFRLIECMRQGAAPDIDVYDAAAWSAPGPLSELSVAKGGAPVKFPDFTRGGWQTATRAMPV